MRAPGGTCLGEGVQVDTELRVPRTPDRALAGAGAARCVPPQGSVLPTEGLRALEREFGVATDHVQRLRGHLQRLFDIVQVRAEARRIGPLDAGLVAPAFEHALRRAIAGPGVDEGRSADAAPDRKQDRRASEGDRAAGIAIEGGEALERMLRAELLDREPPALLDHDNIELRPAPGSSPPSLRRPPTRSRSRRSRFVPATPWTG